MYICCCVREGDWFPPPHFYLKVKINFYCLGQFHVKITSVLKGIS